MSSLSSGNFKGMDKLGRVVIPKSLRERFELHESDLIEFNTTEEGILIKKYEPGCKFCKSLNNLQVFDGNHLCVDCITRISEMKVLHDNEELVAGRCVVCGHDILSKTRIQNQNSEDQVVCPSCNYRQTISMLK